MLLIGKTGGFFYKTKNASVHPCGVPRQVEAILQKVFLKKTFSKDALG